ncbi:trimethylamine methyltransferase family protein [Leucothrix mucor]|uniref:trimethylamine methyltransferase family protein n=1 Tax=Leucothrix mucor TaxID=45248 RepID=UPI0003B37E26|nr:trimethylamine methyltransferase family protein [Leucothrix mucor]
MSTKPRRKRKMSPREAMHAKRAKAPEVNPCPPGPSGGQYKPLSDNEIQQIYDNALRILSEIGMGEVPDALMEKALECGAHQNEQGRLCYSKAMIEDILAGACRKFTYYGRNPKHDFEVGGDKVHFGTGGAAVQTMDLDTHNYRSATLRDLYDFTRLADSLTNVSWFTRCCVATDVEGIKDLDVNTAYALLKGTTKPVGTSFTVAETVDPIIDMFDIAMGGEGKFRERPFCKAHISPVISPLRYGEDAFDVAMACIKRGVPLNNIVAAQSGATAPATLAGMLSSTLAETLAALVMVNVFAPGYPMIFSNWPLVIDLRTGSFCGGGGEITLLNAASAQISNWLGLPSGAAASMSDSKAVDAQMGLEKAMTSLGVGLAGCNMVYESSGMTASLLGASFEAMLIDDEMLSQVYRTLRGIEVTEETLGFEAIKEAVYGEGHFLGGQHTMDAMQRDYFWPSKLTDRQQPAVWEEQGSLDMWQRANVRVKEILEEHQPEYLSPEADVEIRRKYKILLDV